jgi:hypothetical protein
MASPMVPGRRRIVVYIGAGVALEMLAQPGNADSLPFMEGLEPPEYWILKDGLDLRISVGGKSIRCVVMLMLPIALAACAGILPGSGDEGGRSMTYTADRNGTNQPFPNNYRAELLAFMRTYLNDPVGVHEAALADPVQRTVNGHGRYVACVRFTPRESDGSYREPRERAILFIDGRLDRMADKIGELCAGAVYAPFPEMEKMAR